MDDSDSHANEEVVTNEIMKLTYCGSPVTSTKEIIKMLN